MQLRLSSALSGCSVQHLCSLTFLCPRKEPTSCSFFCRGLCFSGFSPRLLFSLCILMRKSHHTHGFSFHPHADDSQIYICDKCNVIYIFISDLLSEPQICLQTTATWISQKYHRPAQVWSHDLVLSCICLPYTCIQSIRFCLFFLFIFSVSTLVHSYHQSSLNGTTGPAFSLVSLDPFYLHHFPPSLHSDHRDLLKNADLIMSLPFPFPVWMLQWLPTVCGRWGRGTSFQRPTWSLSITPAEPSAMSPFALWVPATSV